MGDSNSLTSALLSSEVSSPTIASTASTSSSGFFDGFKNISATTWIIIILILAFLGFNIFVYLAKGTQDISNFFGPFLQKIFGTTLSVAGQTIDVSAEGAKTVVSGTAGAINTGLTDIQDLIPNTSKSSISSQSIQNTIPPADNLANASINKVLNAARPEGSPNDYEAHEASSSFTGKAGWCYIGEDRGFRSCSKVGVNDKCMSGDIFPSQEICVNPSLRA
jgi:hypothetical protein